MLNFLSKEKIIGFIVAIGLALIAIFFVGFGKPSNVPEGPEPVTESVNSESVQVVSTNPNPLEGATILPNQAVEITFSEPMVNDLSRVKIEPEGKVNISVKGDHHILEIKPIEPFKLGQGYTLTILSGYGSDTGKKTDQDYIFHFKTIDYNGV